MNQRALLALLLSLLVPACERVAGKAEPGAGTATGAPTSPRQGKDRSMAHPYFPLRQGASWTYSTGQSHEGKPIPGAESTLEVLAVKDEGSRITAEVVERWSGAAQVGRSGGAAATNHSSGAAASEARQRWVVTREGLLPSSGAMRTSAGEVRGDAPSGVYLPAVLDVQLPWSYAISFDTPISKVAVRGASRLVGFETVQVPAGRFELAAHVRSQVTTHMDVKPQAGMPTVPAVDQVQEEDLWYARGVGLLRAQTRTAAGYASEKQLVTYKGVR